MAADWAVVSMHAVDVSSLGRLAVGRMVVGRLDSGRCIGGQIGRVNSSRCGKVGCGRIQQLVVLVLGSPGGGLVHQWAGPAVAGRGGFMVGGHLVGESSGWAYGGQVQKQASRQQAGWHAVGRSGGRRVE